MDLASWVQILDEVICVLLYALEKYINPALLFSAWVKNRVDWIL